ncbi:MEDS domain-containing protein [Amycolatopsis methanolica]|uniref:MEDS domain-containing protein n=1 Tax=Amycolatopsis methanolica TaxID=1814 RepID=UPI00341F6AE7
MRRSGIVVDARGLGCHDHLCWGYEDPAEFRSRVREFLAEGLALGQRVCYAGTGPVPRLMADLDGIVDGDEASRRGALRVLSLDDLGALGDPHVRLRTYAKATEAALADGYRGLRVAADVTGLLQSPTRLNSLARFEHLADGYSAVHPFSALCGYDRRKLDRPTLALLSALHPSANENRAGFRLHASARGGCCASLGGELDLASAELFPRALGHVDPRPVGGRLVLDATTLDFIDHRNLLALAEHARRHAAEVVLRAPRPEPASVVEVLKLQDIRVEAPR